jgi:hypothetical protein
MSRDLAELVFIDRLPAPHVSSAANPNVLAAGRHESGVGDDHHNLDSARRRPGRGCGRDLRGASM